MRLWRHPLSDPGNNKLLYSCHFFRCSDRKYMRDQMRRMHVISWGNFIQPTVTYISYQEWFGLHWHASTRNKLSNHVKLCEKPLPLFWHPPPHSSISQPDRKVKHDAACRCGAIGPFSISSMPVLESLLSISRKINNPHCPSGGWWTAAQNRGLFSKSTETL